MTRAPTILLLCSTLLCGQAVAVAPPGTNTTSVFTAVAAPPRAVTVTFSLQAGMAKSLASLSLNGYSVTLCSKDGLGMNLGGGAPWQLLKASGLQLVNLHVAALAATQARAKTKWEIAGVIADEALFDLSIIGAANVIHVNPAKVIGKAWRFAPIALSRKLGTFNAERAKIQPDAITAFGPMMLDPGVLYAIPAGMGVCVQKLIVASPGGPAGGHGEIPVY